MTAYDGLKFSNFSEFNNIQTSLIEKKHMIQVLLKSISSYSEFNDLKWVFDLRKKSKNLSISTNTVYFKNIPKDYQEIVKLHVLLLARNSISSAIDFPGKISHLFSFCKTNKLSLNKINIKIFTLYETYINEMINSKTNELYHFDTQSKIWKNAIIFLSTIDWYISLPYLPQLKNRLNPFKKRRNKDTRPPISNDTLYMLDNFFKRESIPYHFKTAYWLMRLFPFRIGEILAIPLNCLKTINEDYMMLSLPKFKNNGGHDLPIIDNELLYLNEENQKYLYNLIQHQQILARELQSDSSDKNNFLFIYKGEDKKLHFLSRFYFAKYINVIVKKLKINEHFVLHQFRTTGATLRSEFGFTTVQLKELLDVDYDTIDNYSKPRKKHLIKLQKEIINDKENKVYWKGNILGARNSFLEKKLLNNPMTHKIPNMGFCSYENQCGNHFECLDCDYLVPDYNLSDYYRETAKEQLKKSVFWEKKGNMTLYQDSLHRATLFTRLYERVIYYKDQYVK